MTATEQTTVMPAEGQTWRCHTTFIGDDGEVLAPAGLAVLVDLVATPAEDPTGPRGCISAIAEGTEFCATPASFLGHFGPMAPVPAGA